MPFFLDLYSPDTFEAFSNSDRSVTGFRERQKNWAQHVHVGDKLLCYITKLSRWCGILEVTSAPFEDDAPMWYEEQNPFPIRFNVTPLVWLTKEKAIPIRDDRLWDALSFTRGQDKRSSRWTGRVRSSLTHIDDADARVIEEWLTAQSHDGETFPVDENNYDSLLIHQVRAPQGVVNVYVPEEVDDSVNGISAPTDEVRESIKVQARLARIGAEMGLRIWIPRQDRALVAKEWVDSNNFLLDLLPVNFDPTTIRTIEQIDVLWMRGRSIIRAFEVEHTTSIYSGILRMADLLALQPNLNIKLHIVAPSARREKVFEQIRRPVFALLEQGPLSERCTYLSYDSVDELAHQRHLAHLADSVLDEYTEEAD